MTHAVRWTIEKVTQRLNLIEPLVYRHRAPLPSFCYCALPDPATPPPLDADDTDWPIIEPDTHWGKPFTDFILRSSFQVPADWTSASPIGLYLPLGDANSFSLPEALAYIDGEPYGTCDRHHQEIILRPEWCDGRSHALTLQGWTGLGGTWNTDPVTRLIMRQCEVVQIDQPTRDFIATARVALGAAQALDPNDPARGLLLNALNAAFNLLDTREPFGESLYASVEPAHSALRSGIAQAGAPLNVRLTATGHAHIDVAWLWTLDQTRRKTGRSFHTVLRLMEQFPDYHFTQSQPQLYDYVRHDYPVLFEGIKERVAEGRWEPIGGMWVEADCNLSGAESLARQFLLGRAFFRKHFGSEADSPVLWLPDVFGYSAALPQLIKQAGLDYFFTIKIGWNQYNRLPYDSFWWEGLDGTRVLTHFSTTTENDADRASTYNAPARPEDVRRTWTHFQQKELQQEVLMTFGYGDGGGGPTREMLENLRELQAFPSMPQVRQRPALDFFRDLERDSGSRLPTWNGELYLEYHRGTYTTQGRNKRANRQSEVLLHDAEFLASYAALLDPNYQYPAEILQQAWQLVCLNQFHDIIPGSSIGQVYVDSQQQYAEVRQLAAAAHDGALDVIADHVGGDVLIVNPTSFVRHDLALLADAVPDGCELVGVAGQPVLTQAVEGGVLIEAGELPPYSMTTLQLFPSPVERGSAQAREGGGSLTITSSLIENDLLRVELNAAGDITRIYDKTNRREVLPPDVVANQFQAFEDRPMFWDAWDIDIYYDDRMWLAYPAESIRVVEAGPLRATLEIERRILNSAYTQRISLRRQSPRLDIETSIDWRERHILLKVASPVDILSPVATYEIQWGNVQRPTHRNTSWDLARFETCAHKWVDLSEGGYGVSLLNDCKYGHDIQGNVIRLSLLRSPTLPDPEADQGEHYFTYSLYPHAGGWNENTQREAYALNDPLIVMMKDAPGGPPTRGAGYGQGRRRSVFIPDPSSFILCDSLNIVIETIKRAEDGHGFIVRLYESQRRRGEVALTTAFDLAAVWRCNLLEENQNEVTAKANRVVLTVKPYEIVTLRLIASSHEGA
jgi:alpha-mannosidase